MRLEILHHGHRFLQKIQLGFFKKILGVVPGPIAVISYNRDFFGKYFAQWVHQTLRRGKHWSVGDLELFAAFVSRANECPYCATAHSSIVKYTENKTLLEEALADYRSSPLPEDKKLVLEFLDKLTRHPDAVTPADVEPLRRAKITDEAIEEALHVCGVFNVMNRLANAFDFEQEPNQSRMGKILLKMGYSTASVRG